MRANAKWSLCKLLQLRPAQEAYFLSMPNIQYIQQRRLCKGALLFFSVMMGGDVALLYISSLVMTYYEKSKRFFDHLISLPVFSAGILEQSIVPARQATYRLLSYRPARLFASIDCSKIPAPKVIKTSFNLVLRKGSGHVVQIPLKTVAFQPLPKTILQLFVLLSYCSYRKRIEKANQNKLYYFNSLRQTNQLFK
jgi:hypothetical protein